MRAKVISKTSDLPQDFSLARYSATSDFSILDWLVNLEFRTLRWHGVAKQSERKLAVNYLFRNSLLPEDVCIAYARNGLTKTVHRSQVRDQSVYDALSNKHYFDEDQRLESYIQHFLNFQGSAATSGDYDILADTPMYEALENGQISHDGEASVVVNLQASEEQLINDFRSWVRQTKKAMRIEVPKKALSSVDLADFHRYQVLAYLDLTLWAAVEGVEISNQTLGLALFPDEYDIILSERIRKVVNPLARRLCTFDFCAFLRSQASSILADQKSVKFVPDEKKSLLGPARVGQQVFPEEEQDSLATRP